MCRLQYWLWYCRELGNVYPRQILPRTIRTQGNSYIRQLEPKTTHIQDNSHPWQLVLKRTRTQLGNLRGVIFKGLFWIDILCQLNDDLMAERPLKGLFWVRVHGPGHKLFCVGVVAGKARSHSALRLKHGQTPSKSDLPWSRRCCSRWCRV